MPESPAGFPLMGAGMPPGMEHARGNNLVASLGGEDGSEPRGYGDELSSGGSVSASLEKQMEGMCSGCARTASASPGWST
ncbi:hypothetical protein ACWZEH_33015 [Streptomyces sp. QTS137]